MQLRTAKPKVTEEINRAKVSVKTKPNDSPNKSLALGVPTGTWLLNTANAMKSVPKEYKVTHQVSPETKDSDVSIIVVMMFIMSVVVVMKYFSHCLSPSSSVFQEARSVRFQYAQLQQQEHSSPLS